MFSHDVPLRRPGAASGGCGLRITKDARRIATRGAWAANGLTAGETGRFYLQATRILTIATGVGLAAAGGGKNRNSIGERSLLGANAGIGISLGDECIVEAGLYVTAETKVKMPDGSIVAARQLSGQSGLLFRRNSQTDAVEVLPTDASRWGGLNASLHNND
ncbi:DapH/DapD/GlmU-related protein [Burkholderia sp. D-99]|uniref:DapH/DapD/GlmU-related protein n=1 Tax=Burkholderia sp. D-99 TaxID=2717316 RepID=UPI0024431D78|nr:DapH/DapD/GlmU-related protein [Burkholderia sp. D-99]